MISCPPKTTCYFEEKSEREREREKIGAKTIHPNRRRAARSVVFVATAIKSALLSSVVSFVRSNSSCYCRCWHHHCYATAVFGSRKTGNRMMMDDDSDGRQQSL